MKKKIRFGIFSFTCCEDSSIMFTILMDDYFFEWNKRIDFVEARVLKKERSDGPLDVALIEGAIVADNQARQLRKIRGRSKKLVAIGSCACTGMPSAIRNDFDVEKKREIQFILERFKYADRVRKIEDVVKVDVLVHGCPMNTDLFLKTLNEVFVEFGHEPVKLKKRTIDHA